MMKLLRSALLCIVLSGCWPNELNKEELVGKWKTELQAGLATLELREDGVFIQTLQTSKSESIVTRGVWKIEPSMGTFRGARLILETKRESDIPSDQPNTAELEMVREWGVQRLVSNPDLPGYMRE